MKSSTSVAALAAVLATPGAAVAQSAPDSPLSIEGSIRVRGEAIDGQFRSKGPENDALISVQTIVKAEYDGGVVRIGGELIDGRVYGQKSNSTVGTADANALEPVQAWIAANLDGVIGSGSKAWLTAGRFTLDIGSGRLAGRAGYPASPSSFAGARFDWKGANGDALTGFWTMPFDREPGGPAEEAQKHVDFDRATSDRQFFGASFTRANMFPGTAVELYAYRLTERDAPGHETRNRRLITYGTRVLRKAAPGEIDYELEVAGQEGKVRASSAATDLTDLDVEAATVHAEAGWTFAGGWHPRVAALFDLGTGNGRDPTRYGRFDTLYGKRRGDFGPTTLYGPLSRSNLISAGVTFGGKPAKGWDFFVKARALWLDSTTDSFASTGIRDAAGASGSYAGTQVEGRVRTWLVPKRLQLEAGGAYLAKGGFLKDAPNVLYTSDTRYGYLALTAKF